MDIQEKPVKINDARAIRLIKARALAERIVLSATPLPRALSSSSKGREYQEGEGMARQNQNSRMAVSDYALLHLAGVGKEAGDIAEDLVEDKICAAGKPYDVEKRRVILRERLVNTLGYIGEGMRNLYVESVRTRRAEKKNPG